MLVAPDVDALALLLKASRRLAGVPPLDFEVRAHLALFRLLAGFARSAVRHVLARILEGGRGVAGRVDHALDDSRVGVDVSAVVRLEGALRELAAQRVGAHLEPRVVGVGEPGQEHCTAPLDDPELTRAVTEALGAANIPYEVKRQSLTVGSDGQLHERATLLFDANDFDRVREVLDATLEEVKADERAQGRDLGKATISLQNDEQTQAVTAALEAEGIPYKVERTTLATDKKEGVVARATVIFPETEFDRVRAIAEEVLPKKGKDGPGGGRGGHEGPADHDDHTPPSPAGPMGDITTKKEYTLDIRDIADGARDGAATYGEFLDRCRAAGLGVTRTSDGTMKFGPLAHVLAQPLAQDLREHAVHPALDALADLITDIRHVTHRPFK